MSVWQTAKACVLWQALRAYHTNPRDAPLGAAHTPAVDRNRGPIDLRLQRRSVRRAARGVQYSALLHSSPTSPLSLDQKPPRNAREERVLLHFSCSPKGMTADKGTLCCPLELHISARVRTLYQPSYHSELHQ